MFQVRVSASAVAVVFVLFLVNACLGAVAAPKKSAYPTNLELIENVAQQAVGAMIEKMPSLSGLGVYLRPVLAHDVAWVIEGELSKGLSRGGATVFVSPGLVPTVHPPGFQAAAADSDTSAVPAAPPVVVAPETKRMVLEYRITELGVGYPSARRAGFIGRKVVERTAVVKISGRLIDETSGTVIWVGEGGYGVTDQVPERELSFLEGKGERWQKGTLPTGKLGVFIEPLVVVAIVAGLVYLFYSNKE
ncbi:MAG: hypothetical protein V2A71_11160 [Candidatus Eisenbacteria bacterium]